MAKKDPCVVSSLVLEIWSFTVYFWGKRRSLLHPEPFYGDLFMVYRTNAL